VILSVVLGVFAIVPGRLLAADQAAVVRVSGPSPYARCSTGGPPQKGHAYTNAEVEPYVAVNPRTVGSGHENIIGVFQQDRLSTEAARGLIAVSSVDSGRTWRETPLPFSSCAIPASPETSASDPWVSIGPDGRAYASTIAVGPRVNAVLVVTSTDGGRSWGQLHAVLQEPNAAGYNDKPSVTADPVRAGRAYVVWDRTPPGKNPPQPTWLSVTADGGRTWSPARRISFQTAPNTGTLGNQVLVDGRRRVLYDIFERYVQPSKVTRRCRPARDHSVCRLVHRHFPPGTVDDFVGFMRSTDGGATWSRARNIAADRGIEVRAGEALFRTGFGVPEAALDRQSGRIYVVWEDARFSGERFQEIALASSGDSGRHWSRPIRVNLGTGVAAFGPAIAVGSTGIVGVTYYALESTGQRGHPLLTDYWFMSSRDHGMHFSRSAPLFGPFDMRTAPKSGGLFLGDYEALAADGSRFRPFFVATNSENLQNRTDVFTTTVTP
jgi:hypothetical protein